MRPNKMNVLIIGSGGREHALVWKVKQSSFAGKVYCLPGNGGISCDVETVDISPGDFKRVAEFADKKLIDLILVGPEAPLASGIRDYFKDKEIIVYGPSSEGAKLESSKVFAKEFMKEYGIPTADYRVFDDPSAASNYVLSRDEIVIKADGLCGGKGVILPSTRRQAAGAVEDLMVKKTMGDAGLKIIVEEKLKGEEVSVLLMVSGENYSVLLPSQDHKPAFDGDKGPNTGGMGAYSPASFVDSELMKKIEKRVAAPAIEGLLARGIKYEGILYLGLMICEDNPHVLEFNVRFGDPEAQAVLPLMKGDLLELILNLRKGKKVNPEWKKGCCVDVVLASGGYPKKYETGLEMQIRDIQEDILLFHAGTRKEGNSFYTDGGRVINIAAIGESITDAREKAYCAAESIKFKGKHFRKDIGLKEVNRK